MNNPQKTMELALKDYATKKEVRKRFAALLVDRAVRFYIEGNLDDSVVQEDLYNYEDFGCTCSQEEADNNRHNKKCEYFSEPYPNLDYSEKHEKEFIKKLRKSV